MAVTTWIVSTDGDHARILELNGQLDDLHEVEPWPEVDDTAGGRGAGPLDRSWPAGAEGMPVAAGDRPELAYLIAGLLEQQRQRGNYDRLVMIAPGGVLSLMVAGLSTQVRRVLVAEMEGDVTDASPTVVRAILPL